MTTHFKMEAASLSIMPLTFFVYKRNPKLIKEGFRCPLLSMPCQNINEKNCQSIDEDTQKPLWQDEETCPLGNYQKTCQRCCWKRNGRGVSLNWSLEVNLLPSLQFAQRGVNMMLLLGEEALETTSNGLGRGVNLNWSP